MDEWKSYLDNTEIIIHAGGLSERWYPVTQGKMPKVLTPLGSKSRPMIDWTILPYAKAGIKKFFVSLWHDPEKIIQHCSNISKNTGIEFIFLNEEGKRMGRAGVVKHYLGNGVLDANKHKIMVGGSDIVNVDLENFTKIHLENLSRGFPVTLIGSESGQSQFDKIISAVTTGRVSTMETDRTIFLAEDESANTGTAYFDSSANRIFLDISEERFPIDWENMINEFENVNCFRTAKIYDSWFPLKTPYDYKKVKDVDFEKWFGVNSVEEHLGAYEPASV